MIAIAFNKKIGRILNGKKGFTLVELIVSMTLMILVIWVAYGFFSASGGFFNINSEKADAQAQSRLIFQKMKIEIGAASSVTIEYKTETEKQSLTENYYYVKNGSFCGPSSVGLPVKGMTVIFQKAENQMVKVILTADGNFNFEGEIFSPNVEVGGGDIGTSGNVISIIPAT